MRALTCVTPVLQPALGETSTSEGPHGRVTSITTRSRGELHAYCSVTVSSPEMSSLDPWHAFSTASLDIVETVATRLGRHRDAMLDDLFKTRFDEPSFRTSLIVDGEQVPFSAYDLADGSRLLHGFVGTSSVGVASVDCSIQCLAWVPADAVHDASHQNI